MNSRERNIYRIEFTVIILLWTLAFVLPVLFMDKYTDDWRATHVMWVESCVVGVAFVVNRFWLTPWLFFTKRYFSYICSLVVLLTLLGIFVLYFDGVNTILNLTFGSPIGEIMEDMPWILGELPPHHTMPRLWAIPPPISVLIISFITIALDVGIRIAVTWVISEQKQAEREQARLLLQLQNLQSQVSPHFFMNTLNNIHALVDIDSKRAKQTIIELSGLMSYLLYESASKETVSTQREFDFVGNYINLMRLRFPKDVKVSFIYDTPPADVYIPPLLFLNFIENAFKYGIDQDCESFIRVTFVIGDSQIEMSVLNSNHAQSSNKKRHGLGIANSRKRLDLIYGSKYSLSISDKDKIFYVTLKIPIQ